MSENVQKNFKRFRGIALACPHSLGGSYVLLLHFHGHLVAN